MRNEDDDDDNDYDDDDDDGDGHIGNDFLLTPLRRPGMR